MDDTFALTREVTRGPSEVWKPKKRVRTGEGKNEKWHFSFLRTQSTEIQTHIRKTQLLKYLVGNKDYPPRAAERWMNPIQTLYFKKAIDFVLYYKLNCLSYIFITQ